MFEICALTLQSSHVRERGTEKLVEHRVFNLGNRKLVDIHSSTQIIYDSGSQVTIMNKELLVNPVPSSELTLSGVVAGANIKSVFKGNCSYPFGDKQQK